MPMLEEALQNENPYQRKAGLLVLAVLSDGAGDHIRQRCLFPSWSEGRVGHGEEDHMAYGSPGLCLSFGPDYQWHIPRLSKVSWFGR